MDLFFDICDRSLRKHGEEVCGDSVKITRAKGRTVAVLSDGLGSGIKASILSTMTCEMVTAMLEGGVPIEEVMRTVVGTLPICQVRKMAYATFTVLEIDERRNRFKVINADNPRVFFIRDGRTVDAQPSVEHVLNREISVLQGDLREGDFLGMATDGVLYAGLGKVMNFGWGWERIGHFLEEGVSAGSKFAEEVVSGLLEETEALYGGEAGDDATFVGMQVRKKRNLVLFTGPPLDRSRDARVVEEFMKAEGKKAICGGTTANIVARHLDVTIETDISSLSEDIPPTGRLKGVDLLTEGIITLARVIEWLKKRPRAHAHPGDDGASRLLAELIYADHIVIFAGRTINPFYQNPLLPKNISIRLGLVNELAELLRAMRKDVSVKLF